MLIEIILEAWIALKRNLTRSFLTMLGIVWGIATVRRPGIAYGDRMVGTAPVRGVCPEYGEMRNEVPSEGRWINAEDEMERRRVIFLGGRLKEELFSGQI